MFAKSRPPLGKTAFSFCVYLHPEKLAVVLKEFNF